MKRTLEEDTTITTTTALTIKPYTSNRIEDAVSSALYDGVSGTLSNQPIILFGVAEDDANNESLAYWPVTKSVGINFLNRLEKLACDQKAVLLMNYLWEIAEGTLTETSENKNDALKRRILCIRFGVTHIGELGHFKLIGPPSSCSVTLEDLSPHLYRQEVMLYC